MSNGKGDKRVQKTLKSLEIITIEFLVKRNQRKRRRKINE